MTAPILHLALAAGLASSVPQGDWPQFRGPGGRCVADDTPIPDAFGPGRNELWRTAVPGGHSSPAIQGGRIFLTGFADGKDVVLALDRATGEVLWSDEVEGEPYVVAAHVDAVPALPTVAADDERIVAYLGNFGLVAYDHDGERLWERPMPQPRFGFGVGTSPVLLDGLLILSRDGAPEAAVLALDAADGSELWRIDRFEYGESHGSPFVWRHDDGDELVVGGTNRLCSFDLASGELLWSVAGLTSFPCTTPAADDDTLYFAAWSTPNATGRSFWEAGFGRSLELSDEEIAAPELFFRRLDADGDGHIVPDEVPECRAKDAFGFLDVDGSGTWEPEEILGSPSSQPGPGRNLMVAVPRGARGDVAEDGLRWTWRRGLPYVASPLVYRGRVWLLKAGGFVTCLDAATGEPIVDRARLPDRSEYYMSPVGAAGRVIAGSAEGTLYVLDAAADELSVLHTASFDDELFATPAVLDGRVYVRSKGTMWAFGAAD